MDFDMQIHVVAIGGGRTVQLGGQDLTGIGSRYVAATTLGGINMRGGAADTPYDAVRLLLTELGQNTGTQASRDAEIAIGLALDGLDVMSLGQTPATSAKAIETAADDA